MDSLSQNFEQINTNNDNSIDKKELETFLKEPNSTDLLKDSLKEEWNKETLKKLINSTLVDKISDIRKDPYWDASNNALILQLYAVLNDVTIDNKVVSVDWGFWPQTLWVLRHCQNNWIWEIDKRNDKPNITKQNSPEKTDEILENSEAVSMDDLLADSYVDVRDWVIKTEQKDVIRNNWLWNETVKETIYSTNDEYLKNFDLSAILDKQWIEIDSKEITKIGDKTFLEFHIDNSWTDKSFNERAIDISTLMVDGQIDNIEKWQIEELLDKEVDSARKEFAFINKEWNKGLIKWSDFIWLENNKVDNFSISANSENPSERLISIEFNSWDLSVSDYVVNIPYKWESDIKDIINTNSKDILNQISSIMSDRNSINIKDNNSSIYSNKTTDLKLAEKSIFDKNNLTREKENNLDENINNFKKDLEASMNIDITSWKYEWKTYEVNFKLDWNELILDSSWNQPGTDKSIKIGKCENLDDVKIIRDSLKDQYKNQVESITEEKKEYI